MCIPAITWRRDRGELDETSEACAYQMPLAVEDVDHSLAPVPGSVPGSLYTASRVRCVRWWVITLVTVSSRSCRSVRASCAYSMAGW